ncbi:ROK family protein [Verrucomicrobia bacterium]|nr:ROK family protein [Verrucomicrobiota bacterium]
MSHAYVGVDVGGTTTTVSVGNEERQVLSVSEQFATRSQDGPGATVEAIVENVCQCVRSEGMELSAIQSIGLATPGPATRDGILGKTPNLKADEWEDFPVRAALEDAMKVYQPEIRVHYVGDGQAAALGEYAIRSKNVSWKEIEVHDEDAKGLSTIFMMVVGTGLGGGEVRSGQVVRGIEGRAGHVGHILLPDYAFRYPHDRELVVGNATCTAESAISLTSLTHQLSYRLTLEQWKGHSLNLMEGSPKDKARKLRGLAASGDELAMELFMDQAKAMGIAFLSVNYLGDYDLLVIGGGVCDLAPAVRDAYRTVVEETYREYALKSFQNLDHIDYSICGDNAPVIGALAHLYLRSLS